MQRTVNSSTEPPRTQTTNLTLRVLIPPSVQHFPEKLPVSLSSAQRLLNTTSCSSGKPQVGVGPEQRVGSTSLTQTGASDLARRFPSFSPRRPSTPGSCSTLGSRVRRALRRARCVPRRPQPSPVHKHVSLIIRIRKGTLRRLNPNNAQTDAILIACPASPTVHSA